MEIVSIIVRVAIKALNKVIHTLAKAQMNMLTTVTTQKPPKYVAESRMRTPIIRRVL